GMGGVTTAKDAIELMMAGASAVQVGTAMFANPFAPIEIIDGMNEYLDKNGIASVKEIIGSVKAW
ncbi:MAG: dihydroorotate dehydrogenase, partial [Clostridiales bacterium]|nr:dihydroorotate dehydrogenase [Clostridiales bacterium]